MKQKEFNVPIYNFNITIIEIESKEDKDQVKSIMEDFKISSEQIKETCDYIEQESMNGGETHRNLLLHKFLVIIYPCKSIDVRREVINHEKRHIEDRMLNYLDINDIEAAAYLAGYLSTYMY